MQEYLKKVSEAVSCVDIEELEMAVRVFKGAREGGNTVWIVGNGGSAATADHLANDLVKLGGVRSVSIPSLTTVLLAYGNDEGWDGMFENVLKSMGRNGDALVAISCSGSSKNVVAAAKLFHHNRLVVMTGNKYDSPLAEMDADAKIFVTSPDIRVQEDVHLAICHAMAGALK